ncbi:MarR family winged helix-turn-helix transcriptional regulator [Pseudonocardia nigra]|uniref:MarR family winged helix-turn-helix transcriptional regulator n=1 Tax=Pseudonocardia nigra TaxID=1921578 RepID=UPI001C5E2D2E|nr:MarR family winged helix-turn-helix transcriptional regulator [Pseudonocardia nigra]
MHEALLEPRPERMPLARLLPRVGTAVARRFARAAAEHGLTPTAFGVLGLLAGSDAVSHRELAAHLGLAPGTLTPVVDTLEARGELRRRRDRGDRRVVRLSITNAGRERLREASGGIAAAMGAALPEPAPEHAAIVRDYLLAVLSATGDEEGARE